jgi:3-methyladenine DNA glycosylase AlkD
MDRGDISDTFAIATRLLVDKHDLIHKAAGWHVAGGGQAFAS